MTLITDKTSLAEALAFYGMGDLDGAAVERVTVAAVIEALTQTSVVCDVINPRPKDAEPFKRCEFLKSEVIVQMYNCNAGLVRLPKTYLPVFCLWKFELRGHLLEAYEERVAVHNAPYFATRGAQKLETIGSVRI